jgi:hypothetical protein
MKTTIQKIGVVTVLSFLAIVTFTLTSCQKEQVARSAQSDQALNSNSNSENVQANADYIYSIGVDTLGIALIGPDTAVTAIKDTFIIEGSGTLSVPAKTVTGGGRFRYASADGTKGANGKWNALELLDFTSWGTSPDFPSNFEAGIARIRIHTSPRSGGPGNDALLFIYCVLPGAASPPGFEEGVRVTILGSGFAEGGDVPNFTEQVGGQTLFIRQ